MSSTSSGREPAPAASEPVVSTRAPQRYVGIHMRLEPDAFTSSIDEGFPELFGWLAAREIEPAGAPLIRYYAMEPSDEHGVIADLDLGVPIAADARPDGWVHVGELPAGTWVSAIHVGSYDGLRDATAALGDWFRAHGHQQLTDADGRAAGWIEQYLTDPRVEPDARQWQTEIAVLVGR